MGSGNKHNEELFKCNGTEVFEKDQLSRAILKGKVNIEASSPKPERAEITVDPMKKLKSNLQRYKKANTKQPDGEFVGNKSQNPYLWILDK